MSDIVSRYQTKLHDRSATAADTLMSRAEVVMKRMESRMTAGDFPGVVKMADPILQGATGLLHPKNFVVCTLSLTCSSAYTSMGNLPMAFTFSQNALEGTTFSYPPKHIAVGSHLLQLVKIGLEMKIRERNLYEDLELLAKNAVDVAAVATGTGSTVYKRAIEMLLTLSTALRTGLPSAIQPHSHAHGGGCCNHHH